MSERNKLLSRRRGACGSRESKGVVVKKNLEYKWLQNSRSHICDKEYSHCFRFNGKDYPKNSSPSVFNRYTKNLGEQGSSFM
jgi:hypothetical protein